MVKRPEAGHRRWCAIGQRRNRSRGEFADEFAATANRATFTATDGYTYVRRLGSRARISGAGRRVTYPDGSV